MIEIVQLGISSVAAIALLLLGFGIIVTVAQERAQRTKPAHVCPERRAATQKMLAAYKARRARGARGK